jgi:hypothetical protein
MEMSMSALDMANEDDLAARLRVEPNESFDGEEEEASRLRVFVDVSCFMGWGGVYSGTCSALKEICNPEYS